jgi:hypothetical protein
MRQKNWGDPLFHAPLVYVTNVRGSIESLQKKHRNVRLLFSGNTDDPVGRLKATE